MHPAGSQALFIKNFDRENDSLGLCILGSLGHRVGVDWYDRFVGEGVLA